MQREFEIGPIRPPSEAESLLLRITRNCSWNKCKFCDLYKGQRFSARPVHEIKEDIDQVALYRKNLLELTSGDLSNERVIIEFLRGFSQETAERYLYVLQWMINGEKSVFLQDANTMALTFDKLREILTHLSEKLPHVHRITSYSRVDALMKFSERQLSELKETGLNRIHSGYETGADSVLSLINKGCTKEQEIEAGQKVKSSGIELSVYFMPGVGGKQLSRENALETADVINKVNPDFVRIRTFVPKYGSGLSDDIDTGFIKACTDMEKAVELKEMIENINGADGYLAGDHIINLFEEVRGTLNQDKEEMLSVFENFEKLGQLEQQRYQIARRMAMVRNLSHMEMLDHEQQNKINGYLSKLDTPEKFENFLLRLLRRYI